MNTTPAPTIHEHGDLKRIAQLAGVSIATVSRVCNDKKVSTDFRIKVLTAQAHVLSERKEALKCAEESAQKALR